MTWSKRGQEFSDECAVAGLTDAAYRTHSEAIDWLYRVEELSGFIPKRMLLRFAGSDEVSDAVEQLLGVGFWRDAGSSWQIVHHADVIRQSIVAQQDKRGRDKRAQAAARKRKFGSNVSADVSAESAPTQSVSQGLRTEGSRQSRTALTTAEPEGRERVARAEGSPKAPSPQNGDGSIPVVHDAQHFPGDGSAGASVQTVTRAKTGRPPIPEAKRDAILSIHARGGLTLKQIASEAGVSKTTAHKVIHQVAS